MIVRPAWVTVADPLCKVAVFMRADGSAQAVVTSNNLRSAVMEVPAPPKGERIVVKRLPDGCVEVVYEAEDVHD
jgi:hypothetical protein